MTGNASVIAAAFAAIAMILTGLMAYRNGRRTNDNQASQNQLGWMTEANREAKEARAEAAAAMTRLRQNDIQLDDQTARLRRLDAQTHELIEWIGRVLARSRQVDPAGQDPAVTELLRVINGGPPSMSNDRIHV